MRLVQLDKLLWIMPLIVLLSNRKTCSFRKQPISGGISLWKLLFWRVRFLRKLKFPTNGDIGPTSFCDCRFSTVTLWCRWPQVTPCHWQKWMLSFQELIIPKGSWVILALNSSNANWSVTLFPLVTEVRNRQNHQRRIKACIWKDEGGESPMEYGSRNFVYLKCW